MPHTSSSERDIWHFHHARTSNRRHQTSSDLAMQRLCHAVPLLRDLHEFGTLRQQRVNIRSGPNVMGTFSHYHTYWCFVWEYLSVLYPNGDDELIRHSWFDTRYQVERPCMMARCNQSINQSNLYRAIVQRRVLQCGYAESKRNVLRRILNVLTDGAVRQFSGREFQSLGAATGKRRTAVSKLCRIGAYAPCTLHHNSTTLQDLWNSTYLLLVVIITIFVIITEWSE